MLKKLFLFYYILFPATTQGTKNIQEEQYFSDWDLELHGVLNFVGVLKQDE